MFFKSEFNFSIVDKYSTIQPTSRVFIEVLVPLGCLCTRNTYQIKRYEYIKLYNIPLECI